MREGPDHEDIIREAAQERDFGMAVAKINRYVNPDERPAAHAELLRNADTLGSPRLRGRLALLALRKARNLDATVPRMRNSRG